MVEFITDKNPIRYINTTEVLLSEDEINNCIEIGISNAYRNTSNPCITKVISELKKAVKQAVNKPRINKE